MATTEERLAALEAKLAQLTATTPTEYYTHQYSGEEIDAAVGRALTGGALDTSVTNVSNQLGTFVRPNLLDNWYFGRPVNQRGQTEYTGNGYTVDRWMIDVQSINVVDNGVALNNALDMFQRCEGNTMNRLLGRTVTLSLLTADNRLFYGTMTLPSDRKSGGEFVTAYTDANGALQCYIDGTDNSNIDQIFRIYTKTTVTILAAKLELGPTQTLAHREGDKWVLNEIPDYGEQLRRCQRYHLGDMQRDAPGRISGKNIAYCIVPIPVTMRQSSAVPIQTFSNYGIIVDKDGTLHVVNNASCIVEADSYLLFLVVSADTMPLGPCIWQDTHFSISKDL